MVDVAFEGGSAFDPDDKQGLSNLGASLLDEGAGDMDSFAFQSALQDNAITFRANVTRDDIRGDVVTTTATLDEAVHLAKLALNQPRFDPEAIERMRRDLLVNIASEAEVPSHLAEVRVLADLYGDIQTWAAHAAPGPPAPAGVDPLPRKA